MDLHKKMIKLEKLEIEIERKKKSIHEIEEKIYRLFDDDNKGISIVQNAIIKYVNPYAAKLVGYSPKEIINTTFFNYIQLDDVSKVAENYVRRLTGDKDAPIIYKVKIRHRDGKSVDVEARASRVKYMGSPAHFAVLEEISEKKKK